MARVSYLFRRDATYYARIDVPKDLVSVTGTTTWKQSLRTKDEVEAKRLLPAVVMKWQRDFDDLRSRRALVPGDREAATWDHYSDMLARDDQRRAQMAGDADIDAATKRAVQRVQSEQIDIHDPLAMLDVAVDVQVAKQAASVDTNARKMKLAEMRKHLAKGETALIAHEVDDYLSRNRLLVDRGSPDWISLARHMMRAEIEALERTLERDRGDYTGQPRDPLVKPATGTRR